MSSDDLGEVKERLKYVKVIDVHNHLNPASLTWELRGRALLSLCGHRAQISGDA